MGRAIFEYRSLGSQCGPIVIAWLHLKKINLRCFYRRYIIVLKLYIVSDVEKHKPTIIWSDYSTISLLAEIGFLLMVSHCFSGCA